METRAPLSVQTEPMDRRPEPATPITMGSAIEARQRNGKGDPDLFGLITETEAYRIYGHLLEDKELRRARTAGALGYLRRKRTIHYRRDELEAFVRAIINWSYVEPCRTISPSPTTRLRTTTPIPMPPASEGPPAASRVISDEVLLRAAAKLRRPPFATR